MNDNDLNEQIVKAVNIIKNSHKIVALTGAGISVESGIPDFRSSHGIWSKLDPMEYLSISGFKKNPEKTWELLFYFDKFIRKAVPNKAHFAIAKLEKLGLLNAVITQNIDNLHQKAGSENVIEFHGNSSSFTCLQCGSRYKIEMVERELIKKTIPLCVDCGFPLKPDVTFFEEPVPVQAIEQAFELASNCDLLLSIGTSAAVSPANHIPYLAKQNNAAIIEINKTKTVISYLSDLTIKGSASEILTKIIYIIEKK